jgi:hypothetical protein
MEFPGSSTSLDQSTESVHLDLSGPLHVGGVDKVRRSRGVWEGVVMDSRKFHPGLPCPTNLRPAGGPPLKRPYGPFRGGSSPGRAAYGRLLPFWIPHTVRL